MQQIKERVRYDLYYPHQLDRALAQHPDFKEAFDRLAADYETDAQQSYQQGLDDAGQSYDQGFDDGVLHEKKFGHDKAFDEGFDEGRKRAESEKRGICQKWAGIQESGVIDVSPRVQANPVPEQSTNHRSMRHDLYYSKTRSPQFRSAFK